VLAAIVAAVEHAWPQPPPVSPTPIVEPIGTAWRFSGRWWLPALSRAGL
jgi:hypothetical protein